MSNTVTNPLLGPVQKKRLDNEVKLLQKEPLHYITAFKDDNDPLIWYFLIKGQKDSPFDEGEFIGKIVHSPSYPQKPPDYYMLTPNGKFSVETKLCLTNSSFHPETWSPTWTINSILVGFYSMFISNHKDEQAGAGFINESEDKKRKYAMESIAFNKKYLSAIDKKFDKSRLVSKK